MLWFAGRIWRLLSWISDMLGSGHLDFWAVLWSETGTMPPKHETNWTGLYLGEWSSGFLPVATVRLAFWLNLACFVIMIIWPPCFQRSNFFLFQGSIPFDIFIHERSRMACHKTCLRSTSLASTLKRYGRWMFELAVGPGNVHFLLFSKIIIYQHVVLEMSISMTRSLQNRKLFVCSPNRESSTFGTTVEHILTSQQARRTAIIFSLHVRGQERANGREKWVETSWVDQERILKGL
jgi:hypothetical protein